ncbi:uncharacterized protein LOC143297300 [Babylonia areolata]|uniref:uncharacterized protein LOC143297300 n=1 Tax=Babylonia areolata TaxID=304850 RepID=UPI003FD1851B
MAERYRPLVEDVQEEEEEGADDLPADYSSGEDIPPTTTTSSSNPREGRSARNGSRPSPFPPSSTPTRQGHHHKVKKKAPPPVPPKRQASLQQQQRGDNHNHNHNHNFPPPTERRLNAARHPAEAVNNRGEEGPRTFARPPHGDNDPLAGRRGVSWDVNMTSSDRPGSGLERFSYLPNTGAAPQPSPTPATVSPPRRSREEEEGRGGRQRAPPTAAAAESFPPRGDEDTMGRIRVLPPAVLPEGSATTTTTAAPLGTRSYPDSSNDAGDGDDDDVFEVNEEDEDLAGLEYLDNDILLEHLRTRFDQQQPYTYIGDSLVAVNPCKPLAIYTKEFHEKYRNLRVRSKAPAHIFWVASQVRRNLLTTGRSQCVVVGGDSGAGKTESTKYILHHLVQSATEDRAQGGRDREPLSQDIVGKLEKVNPLLELFGNASTVLNTNSSRFGKLVELEFDEQGTLITARLECFILEKFRVTSRSPVEKNFHVFYSLFAGLSSQRLSQLGLDLAAESYRILKPWDLTDGVFRTEEEFQKHSSQCALLISILPEVGFNSNEVSSLFSMLSAILLLTSVEFEHPNPDVDDVIELDAMGRMCLERAVEVLELDGEEVVEDFENSLLRVSMEIQGERIIRHKTLRQARDGRDALARELYAVLFYGVIDKINHNLRGGALPTSARTSSIRLLDISGFENVEHRNGFEQFIINATNERLHQFFLQRTFRHELEDYVREGIAPVDVTFRDNAEIVQLIFAKPEGLIPLLEDEIATNGNDQGWLNKCAHRSSQSAHFTSQPAATTFLVLHYAGKVKYSAEGFVTKNSDTVHQNLREVVLRSDNTFVQDYFLVGSEAAADLHQSGRASFRRRQNASRRPVPFAGRDGGAGKRTGKLTGRFTDQYQKSLSGMMSKLQTDTVFVRCIKPNVRLQPHQFQPDVVRDQLLSSGILEVTRMRKDGYPIRTVFADFVKRYKDLLDNVDVSRLRGEEQIRQACDAILSSARVTGHQIGHSKVFLKMRHRDQLDAAVDAKLKERERQAREERERREREERQREERQREERQRAARAEREQRGEEDSSSTTTSSLNTTTSESGFQSDRNERSFRSKADIEAMDRLNEVSENEEEPDEAEVEKEKKEEEEKKKEKEKIKKKREGLGDQPAYNIFRLTERDFENSTELEMKVRRGIRLVMYIIIFCLIVAGGVVSRTALLWLGSDNLLAEQAADVRVILRKVSDTPSFDDFQRDVGPTRLLVCHLAPLMISWLLCLIQVIFGRHDWPSFKAMALVTVLDCAGVVGRCVFLYKVLPGTDFLTALVLGTGVCQVPAVLSLVSHLLAGSPNQPSSSHGWRARARHYVYLALLVLAVLVQLGTVPLVFFSQDIVAAVSGSSTSSKVRLPELWTLIVATTCSSTRWWVNYAFGKFRAHHKDRPSSPSSHSSSSSSHGKQGLSMLRVEMDRIRKTSFVYTGPVQMMVLVGLFFGLNGGKADVLGQVDVMFRSLGEGLVDGEAMGSHLAVYSLVYMHLAATVLTPYLSGIACRLYMQRVAFASPILLVAPASMALTFACTPSDMAHWYNVGNSCITADIRDGAVVVMLALGVLVWASLVVINLHLWYPEVERTAKMERLFAFPYRDPVFLDVSLQCSRRQDKRVNAERNRQHKKADGKFKEGVERPTVYICATMWHEVRQEMLQLLKSLFRVDFDVYTRRKAMSQFQVLEEYSDLYDPEIHIIFDDAFETDAKSKQRVLNSWVKQFIEVMPEAIGSVAKRNIDMQPPIKIPTPYGGRLKYTLPGGTLMYVHLKDKDRIRHRKRWSQVLYLYYLLGYRLMADYKTVDEALRAGDSKLKRRRRLRVRKNTSLLNNISPSKVRQADNIFLMTLDGDVDFRPEAVRLLLDRMKKNKKVAAVCGRIHPIGDGPMVWYQKFEYAVGHWLQKAAEHVFGCVLCCPGCFSLFRGSALMDDNVMRMYTTEATEALHFIQYEQGEDRWLCTLLLQQGWKIEYCAGADALTFAPETFHDFYIQRRRWSPSTLANIIDLISSWRITVKMNDNISVLFMLYQFVLMASSIVAPGLVVFLIAQSYNTVLSIGLGESYVLSVVPVFLYIVLCLKAKTQTQVNAAAILSSVYAIIMLLVTVGTVINLATASILSPDVLFLVALAVIFIFAGFIHPNELFCLFHGILYYLTVPSTFVFLTVFFLCNLNVVSWGTREGPKKVDPSAEQEGQQQPVQEKGKLYKLFEKLGLTAIAQDIKAFVQQMMGIRGQVQSQESKEADGSQSPGNANQSVRPEEPPRRKSPPPVLPRPKPQPVVEPDHTYWIREVDIPGSSAGELEEDEIGFWKFMIDEYLHPIKANKEQQDKISNDLISARNNVVFGYMLLNLMFTLVLLQLRLQQDVLEDTFYIAGKYEPVSTVSLLLFSTLLLTQFCGMLSHRWGTFLHLIASTRIAWFKTNEEEERALTAIQEAQKLTSANAEGDIDLINPDYSDDDDTGDDYTVSISRRTSGNNLVDLGNDPEDPPDYSDSDEEEDTQFGGRSVGYDAVFDRRYKTVRRHLQQQQRLPPRTSLFEKNYAPAPYRPTYRQRNSAHYVRRQSLYIPDAPLGGHRSVYNI